MLSARLVFLVLAAICFFISAIGYPPSERINVQSLGLLFGTLAFFTA